MSELTELPRLNDGELEIADIAESLPTIDAADAAILLREVSSLRGKLEAAERRESHWNERETELTDKFVGAEAELVVLRAQRLAAMGLLERAEGRLADDSPPDAIWWRDVFLLTGAHMVLTDEGWQEGGNKAGLIAEYGADVIEDEVNAPKEQP